MATDRSHSELERTLGLPAALAIGVGTMVGAGIFIFPGLAAGEAGPAAMLSFALGGAIALLVALSTAELATAMPQSGGGYHFVSRTFGPLAGMLVGLAQWVGLVFASAFYLVGFGQYAVDLLMEFGVGIGEPATLIALGTALLLTLVNLVGTESAGNLQNSVVVTLTGILAILFGYGVLEATGLIGQPSWPLPFAPEGFAPVFTTAALIFTSYLGFVQIATVAGEVKEPHRVLPRALIGSVLIVTTLYVLALFVSTSVMTPDRLNELGETAMVEVARSLVGRIGALGVMGAGLLATLSSANASVLSSSRALFALSRDGLVPGFMARINERFNTPHVALLAVGLPIAGLTLFSRIEVLAEVASFLHLIIYGLICITLVTLRRRRPYWFAPTFTAPGGQLIPILGAVASFGLIAFMETLSLLIGGGILIAALLWYLAYARDRTLDEPHPAHIVPALRAPRVLLPVELPDPSPLPAPLLHAFREIEVLVLGYRIVPEQTSPEQSMEETGEAGEKELEELVSGFSGPGTKLEVEQIATSDIVESLQRYVEEEECQAVLTPKPISALEGLLIPIFAADQVNKRLATLVYDLTRRRELPITLLIAQKEGQDEQDAPSADTLRQSTVQQLVRAGVSHDQIRSHTVETDDLIDVMAELEGEADLVILNESRSDSPSGRDSIFATLHEELEDRLDSPTLLVLLERDEESYLDENVAQRTS